MKKILHHFCIIITVFTIKIFGQHEYQIGLPQKHCNGSITYGVGEFTTIKLVEHFNPQMQYKWDISFKLNEDYSKYSQRINLLVWERVRTLQRMLSRQTADIIKQGELRLQNSMLLPGVKYTFNLTMRNRKNNIKESGKYFLIDYVNPQKNVSIYNDSDDIISFKLKGPEYIFSDIPYIVRAEMVLCSNNINYMKFKWNVTNQNDQLLYVHISSTPWMEIEANTFLSFETYKVTCSVFNNKMRALSSDTTYVTVLERLLNIYASPSFISTGQNFPVHIDTDILHSENEISREDVESSLNFHWSCKINDASCENFENKNINNMAINEGFTSEGMHEVEVEVTKSNFHSTAHTIIEVLPKKFQMPNIEIKGQVGWQVLNPRSNFKIQAMVSNLWPGCEMNWSSSNDPECEYLALEKLVQTNQLHYKIRSRELHFLEDLVEFGNESIDMNFNLNLQIREDSLLEGDKCYRFRLSVACPDRNDENYYPKPNTESPVDFSGFMTNISHFVPATKELPVTQAGALQNTSTKLISEHTIESVFSNTSGNAGFGYISGSSITLVTANSTNGTAEHANTLLNTGNMSSHSFAIDLFIDANISSLPIITRNVGSTINGSSTSTSSTTDSEILGETDEYGYFVHDKVSKVTSTASSITESSSFTTSVHTSLNTLSTDITAETDEYGYVIKDKEMKTTHSTQTSTTQNCLTTLPMNNTELSTTQSKTELIFNTIETQNIFIFFNDLNYTLVDVNHNVELSLNRSSFARVSELDKDMEYIFAEIVVQTNAPPTIDNIFIYPAIGQALETVFELKAELAQDRKSDYPLLYKWSYQSDFNEPEIQLGSCYENCTHQVVLPYSDVEISCKLIVCDSWNACSEPLVKYVKTTKPAAVTESTLKSYMEKIHEMVVHKEYSEAFNFAYTLLYTFNKTSYDTCQQMDKFLEEELSKEINFLLNPTSDNWKYVKSFVGDITKIVGFMREKTLFLQEIFKLHDEILSFQSDLARKKRSTDTENIVPSSNFVSIDIVKNFISLNDELMKRTTDISDETFRIFFGKLNMYLAQLCQVISDDEIEIVTPTLKIGLEHLTISNRFDKVLHFIPFKTRNQRRNIKMRFLPLIRKYLRNYDYCVAKFLFSEILSQTSQENRFGVEVFEKGNNALLNLSPNEQNIIQFHIPVNLTSKQKFKLTYWNNGNENKNVCSNVIPSQDILYLDCRYLGLYSLLEKNEEENKVNTEKNDIRTTTETYLNTSESEIIEDTSYPENTEITKIANALERDDIIIYFLVFFICVTLVSTIILRRIISKRNTVNIERKITRQQYSLKYAQFFEEDMMCETGKLDDVNNFQRPF